jgi:D-alanine-D-alanine ligase-like ATP-grasp enzyme
MWVFIAMHGAYSEDGEIQKILHRINIPFTGSASLPSAPSL